MEEQKIYSLSIEDIVVERDIEKVEQSSDKEKNRGNKPKFLSEDYPSED